MPWARRIYGWLLRLQPARFREEYGELLEREFWEEYREMKGRGRRVWFWLRALADLATSIPMQRAREARQDIRYALRVWRKRWPVTILAVATLALTIGAVTGVFSVLNALLLRSLPFRDAERLVAFENPAVNTGDRAVFLDWLNQSTYLEEATVYFTSEMNVNQSSGSARGRVSETSASFFATFGVEPVLGRAFTPDEDMPGRSDVAVISNGLWQQLFGGDARALGATIRLNGVPVTVVGVASAGFDYPAETAVWVPTIFDRRRLPKSTSLAFGVDGRLKEGVGVAQASAMAEAEARRLRTESTGGEQEEQRSPLLSLREETAGPVARASLVLMGVVGFVLLIACANIAHLLLSRVAERRSELAVRAALGASRARLVQQLITESIVLTLAASVAGLVVAHWASRIAYMARPTQLRDLAQVAKLSPVYTILDWRVLAFTAAVAVLTGLVFGVLPAVLMGRVLQARDAVRIQSSTQHLSAGRMRTTLIGVQAALTIILLTGSFAVGRSFLQLLGTDLGFQTERVATLSVSLQGTQHVSAEAKRRYYSEALERLRAIPGVEFVGAVQNLPLIPNTRALLSKFELDSSHSAPSGLVSASPGYFPAIGTRIVEGREFTTADIQGSTPVAIVNEAFAEGLGMSSGLIGRKILSFMGRKEYTIVGVARTERLAGPSRPGSARVFTLLDQEPPSFVTFVARTSGEPSQYLSLCRRAVQEVDPAVPVYDVKTLGQRLDDLLAGSRFYTVAVLFFATLAILLAVIGVYGVAAHTTLQRTHEIGVRIALGATIGQVRHMLIVRGVLPVAAGTIVGIAAAHGSGRFIQHLIENAQPTGIWTYATAALGLTATAAASIWMATRRVTQKDPVAALKAE